MRTMTGVETGLAFSTLVGNLMAKSIPIGSSFPALFIVRSRLVLLAIAIMMLSSSLRCVDGTTRVALSSTHCYGALGRKGLLIFPIDRLSESVVVPPPVGLGWVHDIFLEPGGRFLFVLSLRAGSAAGGAFAVLSLANPTNPTLVGSSVPVLASRYGAICGKAGTLVIAGGESNLTVWKYSTLTGEIASTTPELSIRVGISQDRVLLSDNGRAAYVKGELDPTLGMGVGYGVMIVPLDNPTAISPIQVPNAPASLLTTPLPVVFPMESALSADGKVIFTAHGDGVSAINVSDPTDCTMLTDFETMPDQYYSIAVVGQQAFAVGYLPNAQLIEISVKDSSALSVTKVLRLGCKRPVSIAANTNAFYVADQDSDTVVVIDRVADMATYVSPGLRTGGTTRPGSTGHGSRGHRRRRPRQSVIPPDKRG